MYQVSGKIENLGNPSLNLPNGFLNI